MKSKLSVGIASLHCLNGLTTFSFAVLFSSLALYLTSCLKLNYEDSNSIVALFLALNFALHLLSGYIGGRFLSNRLLYLSSLLFQILGIFILGAVDSNFLFWGLSFFLLGCGFNSTCLNCLLTQQFEPDDDRRERAFFLNYCAMNMGFFMGFLASGFYDLLNNYQHLFYLCNLINLMALIVLMCSWKHLKDKGTPLSKIKASLLNRYRFMGLMIIVLLIPLLLMGFQQSNRANNLVLILGAFMLVVIFYCAWINKDPLEKGKLYAYLILSLSSLVFWMLYFVGPMGVMHFLKYNVDLVLFDHIIPPQWIMNLNAFFVIFGSPALAFVLTLLRKKGLIISISRQFVFSLISIALSFYFLSLGIFFADPYGLSHSVWVVLYFLAQALGELLLAPVGSAMIGKLAPANLQGIMMGTWMMISGVAATLAHYFSNIMTQSVSVDPLVTNANYFDAFNQLGLYALSGAFVLYVMSSKLDGLA